MEEENHDRVEGEREEMVENEFEEEDYEEENIELKVDMTVENVIVVDNLPVIPLAKKEKLMLVLKKMYREVGKIVEIDMPMGEGGQSKGFAFIVFSSVQEALSAIQNSNGYRLDKNHVFTVSSLSEFEAIFNTSDTYVPPESNDAAPKENLREWLQDGQARDQFVTRHGDLTDIFWMDAQKEPEIINSRRNWTDSFVKWSPLGTYLVTFHRQGIALWGGKSWEKIMRFAHTNVESAEFSPNESYLVTYSDVKKDNPRDPSSLVIWDVRTGVKARGFLRPGRTDLEWPYFRWSADEKYVAVMGKNTISVYETPSMALLDKKSIVIEGVESFCWSPTTNTISYWTPEVGNIPARVSLMEIPSRNVLRHKNLFNVSECHMHWQNEGKYLCVKVDRTSKSKTKAYASFEILRALERDVPVDTLEIKDKIVAFAWEPSGDRFALIHGDGPRPDIGFYSLVEKDTQKQALALVGELKNKSANMLFWSPKGSHLLLAGLRNLNGYLEFIDVDNMRTMNNDVCEHLLATAIEWDPSGRYVASYVSSLRHNHENGFKLWSFQGQLLHSFNKHLFYQLIWRPRPPSLLSNSQKKKIRRNLKEYSIRYEREDEVARDAVNNELRAERKEMRREFDEYLVHLKQRYEEERPLRAKLRRNRLESDDEDNFDFVEETIEQLVQTVEEEVK